MSSESSVRAHLRVMQGPQEGEVFTIEGERGLAYSIGRSRENTICLQDNEVSRSHATILFDGAEFRLGDNGSTNGTFINGLLADDDVLYNGDTLRVGDTVLAFELPHAQTMRPMVADSVVFRRDTDPGAEPDVSLALATDKYDAYVEPPRETSDLEKLRESNERLALLHEVNRAVASSPDMQAMFETIMQRLLAVKPFDRGFLLTLNAEEELEVAHAYGKDGDRRQALGISRTLLDHVVEDRVATLCSDLLNDPLVAESDSVRISSVRSAVSVPLIANDEVLGVLHLDSESVQNALTEEDLRLFTTIGNDLAIAMANQRMTERLLERQRIEQELELASQLQAQFLPTHKPGDEAIELYARALPARRVGGDFYDYFRLGKRRTGLAIGDVSGKGIPAALLMVKTLADFRALALEAPDDPAAVMTALDRRVAEGAARGMFVTMVYLIVDTAAMTLEYVNAGHLAPRLVREGDEPRVLGDAHGPPLGISGDSAFESTTFELQSGDALFLTTDGLTEARNADGEEATDALMHAVLCQPNTEPRALVDNAFETVLRFIGNAPQHDDLSALAIRLPSTSDDLSAPRRLKVQLRDTR